MHKKKIKTSKGKPLLSEQSLTEQIGYFTVLVEGMRDDMKGFGEQLSATRVEFGEKLDMRTHELKAEIQLTQQAVKANSREIKHSQQALKASHQELKADIQAVDEKLTNEIQRVETKLSKDIQVVDEKLTKEIQRVETKLTGDIKSVEIKLSGEIREVGGKLDKVSDVVERHDEGIVFLKTALAKSEI